MKKSIIVLSSLALISMASVAYAYGPGKQCNHEGRGHQGMSVLMAKYLELSDEQIAQIKSIKHEAKLAMKEKVFAVLTPEQQEKFKSVKTEMKEHKKGGKRKDY